MKPFELPAPANAAQHTGNKRVSITTTGHGWRRVDTITRVRDKPAWHDRIGRVPALWAARLAFRCPVSVDQQVRRLTSSGA